MPFTDTAQDPTTRQEFARLTGRPNWTSDRTVAGLVHARLFRLYSLTGLTKFLENGPPEPGSKDAEAERVWFFVVRDAALAITWVREWLNARARQSPCLSRHLELKPTSASPPTQQHETGDDDPLMNYTSRPQTTLHIP